MAATEEQWEQYWEQWADAVELAAAEGRTAAMYAMIRRKYRPSVRQAPEPPERQDDCVDYIEGLLTHPTIPLPPQQMHVAPTDPLPPVRTHTPMMTSTNETLEKHVLMETGTRKRGTQINFGYGVAGSGTIEMSGRCWGKPQCAERALLCGMIELLERVKQKQPPERVVVWCASPYLYTVEQKLYWLAEHDFVDLEHAELIREWRRIQRRGRIGLQCHSFGDAPTRYTRVPHVAT